LNQFIHLFLHASSVVFDEVLHWIVSVTMNSLQCFDSVGWVTGKACGL